MFLIAAGWTQLEPWTTITETLNFIILPLWLLLLVGIIIFGGRYLRQWLRKQPKPVPVPESVKFEDIAGCDEAVEEVQEASAMLKEPDRYEALGARMPHGILLFGEPGTGKTLIAKAVANEAGAAFFSASGSDFVEKFVGTGAARMRTLFEEARKHAPSVIFIDELDACASKRTDGGDGGTGERDQTLNALLVELDGFIGGEEVLLIAATNRREILDPAVLRPGRIDRHIRVGLPDSYGREQILQIHTKRKPLADDVDLSRLAKATAGSSGAVLANICNEAAIFAGRDGVSEITNEHLELAMEKEVMGTAQRRSLIEEEKRIVAYHEAGHALAALNLDETDPVHKVSVVPRGDALGVTMHLPDEERRLHTKTRLFNRLVVIQGGRAAEFLIGVETTGGASDLQVAHDLARKMVTQYGMSYAESAVPVSDYATSEDARRRADQEVLRLTEEAYHLAIEILAAREDHLETLKEALLERETITSTELGEMFLVQPEGAL